MLAERLDEGLHALDLLWSGEPVTYHGKQVTVDDVTFLPTPVQRPRVPIWVGGFWPNKKPMRRAMGRGDPGDGRIRHRTPPGS